MSWLSRAVRVPDTHRLRAAGHTGKRLFTALLRTAILTGLAYTLLYPFLFMLSTAFRAEADFFDPGVAWITRHYTLQNIRDLVAFMDYPKLFTFTLQVTLGSALLQMFVCCFVGYGFARFRFPLKRFWFLLVVLTLIVPLQTYTTPLFVEFHFFRIPLYSQIADLIHPGAGTLNLLNTPFVFWIQSLFGMGIKAGLYIYLYRQAFRGVPKELEEAAVIDGCGTMGTFWRIMLPNCKVTMLTVFLFSFVWHWNDYYMSNVLCSTNRTLSVALTELRGALFRLSEYADNRVIQAKIQAGVLIALVPLIILFLVGQKYFKEGGERAGIVG